MLQDYSEGVKYLVILSPKSHEFNTKQEIFPSDECPSRKI